MARDQSDDQKIAKQAAVVEKLVKEGKKLDAALKKACKELESLAKK